MKKIIIILLCIFLITPVVIFGADGNIDTGGGDMGGVVKGYKWTPGEEGVRVTVIKDETKQPVTTPIDFTNVKNPNVKYHFGKVSKISYKNGAKLTRYSTATKGYVSKRPSSGNIPIIIKSNNRKPDMKKIKAYFCDKVFIQTLSKLTGMNYEELVCGEYKLLIEPIGYCTIKGERYALTAHEAALYDEQLKGTLRSKMPSFSHKNLPLSLFLENADLGFPAWKGTTNNKQLNSTIKEKLGLGIIYFGNESEEEKPPEIDIKPDPPNPNPPKPDEGGDEGKDVKEYEYRTDTDVISSVLISGRNRTPDHPVNVSFKIKDKTYTMKNIYLPKKGGSQYAWVKWHTPKTPEKIIITVSSNATSETSKIIANVSDLEEKTPPDPKAKDKAEPKYTDNNGKFKIPNLPDDKGKTTSTYGEWDCYWIPHWVYYSDGEGGGEWVDEGWWEWKWIPYTVNLSATMNIKADSKTLTAKSNGKEIKSGYGIELKVDANVSYNAPEGSVTGAQNIVTYYPEFYYKEYNRVLQTIKKGYNSSFELKNNKYCPFNDKVHFTTLWFTDGKYVPYGNVMDVWTPEGMLSLNVNDFINIKGNLYQDYHFGPIKSVS
ncbi:hypothetical protein KGF43_15505 [Clostridioides sp. ZZV14-6044]|uniref:hypothetical protein n=1 Tax=Clostridioides sp. ZZV14-6044 TaxID=2811488 RepID=UPI001D12B09F|nr:hypothetical protein [Clostridioides sp. ZZV14-6044]